jgi:hypothetical protein
VSWKVNSGSVFGFGVDGNKFVSRWEAAVRSCLCSTKIRKVVAQSSSQLTFEVSVLASKVPCKMSGIDEHGDFDALMVVLRLKSVMIFYTTLLELPLYCERPKILYGVLVLTL